MRFFATCAAQNKNRQLRLIALGDLAQHSPSARVFNEAVKMVEGMPTWRLDRAQGARTLLLALGDGRVPASEHQVVDWIWRLARASREAQFRRVAAGLPNGRDLARSLAGKSGQAAYDAGTADRRDGAVGAARRRRRAGRHRLHDRPEREPPARPGGRDGSWPTRAPSRPPWPPTFRCPAACAARGRRSASSGPPRPRRRPSRRRPQGPRRSRRPRPTPSRPRTATPPTRRRAAAVAAAVAAGPPRRRPWRPPTGRSRRRSGRARARARLRRRPTVRRRPRGCRAPRRPGRSPAAAASGLPVSSSSPAPAPVPPPSRPPTSRPPRSRAAGAARRPPPSRSPSSPRPRRRCRGAAARPSHEAGRRRAARRPTRSGGPGRRGRAEATADALARGCRPGRGARARRDRARGARAGPPDAPPRRRRRRRARGAVRACGGRPGRAGAPSPQHRRGRRRPRHQRRLSAPLTRYDHVLLDLDGAVYVGRSVVPGAPEAIAALQGAGIRTAFVTNDPVSARADYVRRLGRFGIAVGRGRRRDGGVGRRPARGGGASRRPRARAGLRGVPRRASPGRPADSSTAGRPRGACRSAATSTSPSPTCSPPSAPCWPARRSTAPTATARSRTTAARRPRAGALVAAVEYAADANARCAGKPERAMFDEARRLLGDGRYLMVGDRLDADVAGGAAAGMDTALVLTGTARRERSSAGRARRRPTCWSRSPRCRRSSASPDHL